MYFILDIIIICLIVTAIVTAFKNAFIGTCFDIFGSILFLGVSAILSMGVLVLAYKVGAIDSLAVAIYRGIGGTNAFFKFIGITSEAVSFYASMFVFFVVFFIAFFILTMFLFRFIAKSLESLREDKLIRVLDNVLGVIFNLAVVIGVILVAFSFVHTLSLQGRAYYISEVIRACPISGFIYRYNPLNGIFDSFDIASKLSVLFANG